MRPLPKGNENWQCHIIHATRELASTIIHKKIVPVASAVVGLTARECRQVSLFAAGVRLFASAAFLLRRVACARWRPRMCVASKHLAETSNNGGGGGPRSGRTGPSASSSVAAGPEGLDNVGCSRGSSNDRWWCYAGGNVKAGRPMSGV